MYVYQEYMANKYQGRCIFFEKTIAYWVDL